MSAPVDVPADAADFAPTTIRLDLPAPGGDRFAELKQIRRDPRTLGLTLIAMTTSSAAAVAATERHGMRAPTNPFAPPELLALLDARDGR